jgi:hypothetical protein
MNGTTKNIITNYNAAIIPSDRNVVSTLSINTPSVIVLGISIILVLVAIISILG